MPSLSDDFQMPIMYQDLRNPSMGMMPQFGMYTNLLGGVRMQSDLAQDQFVLQNRKKKDLNALKAAGLVIIGLATGLALRNKGVFKWVSNNWGKATTWIKKTWNGFTSKFKKKPPATSPAAPTPAAAPAPAPSSAVPKAGTP